VFNKIDILSLLVVHSTVSPLLLRTITAILYYTLLRSLLYHILLTKAQDDDQPGFIFQQNKK
jgi:hypothetical protein